jgi:acyl CoA:acetate/3-ketoacid CoA transferase alpha subunit
MRLSLSARNLQSRSKIPLKDDQPEGSDDQLQLINSLMKEARLMETPRAGGFRLPPTLLPFHFGEDTHENLVWDQCK